MAKSILLIVALVALTTVGLAKDEGRGFLPCMEIEGGSSILGNLKSKGSVGYVSAFEGGQQNTRWLHNSSLAGPAFILSPVGDSHVRAAVVCCRKNGLRIRTRSGGHDYEGLSWISDEFPFLLIDLSDFNKVDIDSRSMTAWVQTGATLGELYHAISESSPVLAFPGGTCPTVGTAGLISGGGLGMLARSHGLAAEHVIDSRIVDADGSIMDRKSMGEEFFWAIRGGGGASFGVILAWKLKLVRVPSRTTVFSVRRNQSQGAIRLVHKWQSVAHQLDDRLLIRVLLQPSVSIPRAAYAKFNSQFMGSSKELLRIMEKEFPELGLTEEDCLELPWIQTVMFIYGLPHTPSSLSLLLNRTDQYKQSYKGKSDFVTTPIPIHAIEQLWIRLAEEKQEPLVIFDPLGGKIAANSNSSLPFPYRKGFIYNIQYLNKWSSKTPEEAEGRTKWIRAVYEFMAGFVSVNPRSAYSNYRDLDLGVNDPEYGYGAAKVWGERYFGVNFERLAGVKRKVDPSNFFRNQQSIPPSS